MIRRLFYVFWGLALAWAALIIFGVDSEQWETTFLGWAIVTAAPIITVALLHYVIVPSFDDF